jgi:hypothetical protein
VFNVPVNKTASDVLAISNTVSPGGEDLVWSINEEEVTLLLGDGRKLPIPLRERTLDKNESSAHDISLTTPARAARDSYPRGKYPPSIGPAPVDGIGTASSEPTVFGFLTPGNSGFGIETVASEFTQLDLDIPGVLNSVAANTGTAFSGAGAFGLGDQSFVYQLDSDNHFAEVDTSTGAATVLTSPIPPGTETWSGLETDPTDGTLYGISTNVATSTLSIINPATGGVTTIGATGMAGGIALAIDGNGDMWSYDIVTDQFFSLNKSTGAATPVGPLGFDANFGQGMAWDPVTNQVYMAAFNNTTFQPELRIVNTSTGSSSLVGVIGATVPGGLRQLGWIGIPGVAPDCPWLSANPTSGSVPAGGSQNVDVIVDATGLAPGTYNCNLRIKSNDPDENPVIVPVQLNVTTSAVVGFVDCPTEAPQDCPIVGEIKIDMTGSPPPDGLLGSFTGTLNWDPSLLSYAGDSGILSGFTGVVNVDAPGGLITFNGANPTGVGGVVDILNVDFDVTGSVGSTGTSDLGFSAMAAAVTFTDLLPGLAVNDCGVMITTPGLLGDVNGDDLVNSTDALIILSFDAGLTIPQPFLDRINAGFGDVNSDGPTNSTDALIVLSFDAGIPVPFPLGDPFCPPAPSALPVASVLTGGEKIRATAIPASSSTTGGTSIEIPLLIDLRDFPEELGSLTATLEWNSGVLQFERYTGGSTVGFESPVVNSSELDKGELVFANAHPYGADGVVNVLNAYFKKIAGEGSTISLEFSAMAAAETFRDLLPYVDDQVEFEIMEIPESYKLGHFPNPFNPSTKISYNLPKDELVEIAVYNVLGQRVRTLVNEKQPAGAYIVEWHGKNDHNQMVPSGVYFLRMHAGEFVGERKLLLLK